MEMRFGSNSFSMEIFSLTCSLRKSGRIGIFRRIIQFFTTLQVLKEKPSSFTNYSEEEPRNSARRKEFN